MIYRVLHRTSYKYVYPVSAGNHVACLKPRSFALNRLEQYSLNIHPQPVTMTERADYFGNELCLFTIEDPHRELVVEARSEVVIQGDGSPQLQESLPWEESVGFLSATRQLD